MTLSVDVLEEIHSQVMDGYYDRETMVESILGLFDDLDPEELEAELDAELARKATEMLTWPAVTDNDRLRVVFAELTSTGHVSLENCGVTRQDGIDLAWDRGLELEAETGTRPRGFCFFHQQDVMTALDGDGLYLCYGTLQDLAQTENVENQRDREIGEAVAAACRSHGFTVEWNGSPDTRILLAGFRWQHRGPVLTAMP